MNLYQAKKRIFTMTETQLVKLKELLPPHTKGKVNEGNLTLTDQIHQTISYRLRQMKREITNTVDLEVLFSAAETQQKATTNE